jgi:UDP-glucose 4-epimerase
MKILITGGAGFIGTNLIAHLHAKKGFDITVLDNESIGRRRNLAAFDVRFVEGDIRRADDLRAAVDGQDAIVHLAADTRVMDSIENPQHNFETNVVASFQLLQIARECGVGRIINASTGGAIIGDATPPVDESMAARPLAPYGASKLAVEGYLSAFAGSYGMKAVSLRFSNIYGPYSFHKGSVVAHFMRRILAGEPLTVYGDGSQSRDFLFSVDLADTIADVIRSDATGVYQLGSGRPTTVDELIEAIRPLVAPKKVTVTYEAPRAGEIHATWCNISNAARDLGFAPKTTLRDGLARTWQWFCDTAAR